MRSTAFTCSQQKKSFEFDAGAHCEEERMRLDATATMLLLMISSISQGLI